MIKIGEFLMHFMRNYKPSLPKYLKTSLDVRNDTYNIRPCDRLVVNHECNFNQQEIV